MNLNYYIGRLLRFSPLHNLYGLTLFLGQRSRSAPHESLLLYPKDTQARPMFLMGFARSGTTTTQRILSEVFAYNTSFEPIGFNHSQWSQEQFAEVHVYLKGSPAIPTLPLFKLGGGSLSALHSMTHVEIRNKIQDLLKQYLHHLIEFYGRNVVIKELRLIGNLPTVAEICRQLELQPIFIFILTHPLIPLYTFYRMGGMVSRNDGMGVDELYEYRKLTYASMGLFPDLRDFPCQNRFDKLLVAILLDQAYMRHFAFQYPEICYTLDFEALPAAIQELSTKFNLVQRQATSIKLDQPRRYQQDFIFIEKCKKELHPDLLHQLKLQRPDCLDPFTTRLKQSWLTALSLRILETM